MLDDAVAGPREPRSQFQDLSIADVERDAADGLHITFAVPAALSEEFRFRPGQHLTLRATVEGTEVRRSYSICSGPGAPLAVAIKRVGDGLFSTWAHASLKRGDTIGVSRPAGRFGLPAADGSPRTYLAIAAGSGITPIISMLRHALVEEPEARFILIYGNRSTASILFRDALEDLKDAALGRLTVLHVLSRGEQADVPQLSGRIDADRIAALVPRLVPVASISHAVLCGPDTLIKTAMQALQALGVPRERIGFEFFVRGREPQAARAAPAATASEPAGGAELAVTLDGSRRVLTMRPGETLLEAALRGGLNAPYSCRGGMCCTCRARLVEGGASMDQNFSLEAWEEERGFILTCQARPTTDRVAIDYDQM